MLKGRLRSISRCTPTPSREWTTRGQSVWHSPLPFVCAFSLSWLALGVFPPRRPQSAGPPPRALARVDARCQLQDKMEGVGGKGLGGGATPPYLHPPRFFGSQPSGRTATSRASIEKRANLTYVAAFSHRSCLVRRRRPAAAFICCIFCRQQELGQEAEVVGCCLSPPFAAAESRKLLHCTSTSLSSCSRCRRGLILHGSRKLLRCITTSLSSCSRCRRGLILHGCHRTHE